MKTLFEVLFVVSMIVPPAAAGVGMVMLFGALLANGPRHAGDVAAARPGETVLEQPAGR